ncbi:MAG: hypothetical protein SNJ59_16045 [Aggregatilineales bacterium]
MTANLREVTAQIDDRVRLIGALLAATRYPDEVQARHGHGTHAHARATRRQVLALRDHPAARGLQTMLDAAVPLEALFALGISWEWPSLSAPKLPNWAPPSWDADCRDFMQRAELPAWWAGEAEVWQASLLEVQTLLDRALLGAFLERFTGPIQTRLVFMPHLSYPTNHELALRAGGALLAIVPPRLAWGDSPPWPFEEDPAHVYRAAIIAFGRLLLQDYLRAQPEVLAAAVRTPLPVSPAFAARHPTWYEQFTALYLGGAVAIYLEQHVSAAEAEAFVLMERKVCANTLLPAAIHVLRHYLQERERGRYRELADLLPLFTKQLRVASRIVAL